MSASIHLPPHLRAWLDGWGQELRTDLEQAFHAVASPIAWPDFIFDAKPLQGSRLAAQAVQAVQAIPVPHVVLELALTAVGWKVPSML